MFDLKNATVLTRAQQKNVKGGGSCAYYDGDFTVKAGISKASALSELRKGGAGGRWCCDSCSSAWWYQRATN